MLLNRFLFPAGVIFLVIFIYYFSAITMPFAAAGVLAYIFQPIVSYLERICLPRWLGSLLVTALILTIVIVFFVYTAPILYTQLTKFILQIPGYIRQFQNLIKDLFDALSHRVPSEYAEQIQDGIQAISKDFVTWLFMKTQSFFQGGIIIIHYLTVTLLIPILTFYLMKDWPKLIQNIEYYIPPQNKKTVAEQSKKIDATLASFARGQAVVCLILAGYYSLTLHILGVDFGALIGSLTGIFAFIPYIGAILGFSTSSIIALLQTSKWLFGESGSIGLFGGVAIVFVVGQFLEGVILSPNIVGKSIKLHPLWIMFALFFGGYLFGFIGVLVATPVAGVLGVLLRHALNQYLEKMRRIHRGYIRQKVKKNGEKS